MLRLNDLDCNTPENYDEIYFGERTRDLMPYIDMVNLLKSYDFTGKDILDIGCGMGRYFYCFEGANIFATELSEKCIEFVKKHYPFTFISKWSLGEKLPCTWKNFDFIWCGEVLEHVENPQELVKLVYERLKLGGTAIFTTPFEDSIICQEHIWAFKREDLEEMFCNFDISIMRISNEPIDRWEHFVIVAKK